LEVLCAPMITMGRRRSIHLLRGGLSGVHVVRGAKTEFLSDMFLGPVSRPVPRSLNPHSALEPNELLVLAVMDLALIQIVIIHP